MFQRSFQPGTDTGILPRRHSVPVRRARSTRLYGFLHSFSRNQAAGRPVRCATPVEAAALTAAYAFFIEVIIHRDLDLVRGNDLAGATLYGLTQEGGLYNGGTVFALPIPCITGTITLAGSPLAGVTMAGLPGNPVTDGGGHYAGPVGFGWSGTVTPSAASSVRWCG